MYAAPMNIALDIPHDRRTIGSLRLSLLIALTFLTIALSYSNSAEGDVADSTNTAYRFGEVMPR